MSFHCFLLVFLKISFSIISDTKMANDRAPVGDRRLQIRPFLVDEEVPRGEQEIGSQFITVGIQKGSK